MSLHFTFRKIEATDALKDRITKRVEKFRKFVTYPMEIHVTMGLERALHCAEIVCHAEHRELVAVAKTKDLYEAIDIVAHKIENQLKKQREKRKSRTAAHLATRANGIKLGRDVSINFPHRDKKILKTIV